MKNLKVLMLNGSPHANGNTAVALREMEKVFMENGVAVETVLVGDKAVRGCAACNGCKKTGKCVFDDVVNDVSPKFEAANGLVVASPVYYASANATLIACLDRLFYSSSFDKAMKVGASIACARRSGMPIAPSQYWNSIHGCTPGEAEADEEGKQTMRALARNMIFLMQSIALGKEQFGLPEKEPRVSTNFIR